MAGYRRALALALPLILSSMNLPPKSGKAWWCIPGPMWSELPQTVYDYKTVVDGKSGWRKIVDGYRHEAKQRQLIFYAYQLGLHGINIKRRIFVRGLE
jgi:hypothetical protein